MREEFNLLIISCGIRTVPAAKTKSIGLQADARVVMVFARHLDNFIVTRQILPTYRDYAKTHANPDTDGNIKPPGR
jgi:hypothetical protein